MRSRWTTRTHHSVRSYAGVGDQDTTCPNGTEGCPGGGDIEELCYDCFWDRSDS